MSPDLPEKVLDISLDDPGERAPPESDEEEEELERFLFFQIGHQRLAIDVDDVKTIIEQPEAVTRVPRAPPAIEGVTDIRGEITAIVEPRVHFPTEDPPAGERQLIVFDRPADRQAAAMYVDAVNGVDAIPVSDVLDSAAVESSEFDGHSLDHPLVDALLERERVRADADSTGSTDERPVTAAVAPSEGASNAFADPFEGTAAEPTNVAESGRTVVVEATPLVDVDRLLLASGHPSRGSRIEPA